MAKMCIISGEEAPDGYPVEDTQVIKAIRAFKQKFKMAANNELVVSKASYPEYKKKRKSFEQKLILHIAVGAVILLISVVFPLFSGRGVEPISLIMILLLSIFFVALAMLSYIPPIKKGFEPVEKVQVSAPEPTPSPLVSDSKQIRPASSSSAGKTDKKSHAPSKKARARRG